MLRFARIKHSTDGKHCETRQEFLLQSSSVFEFIIYDLTMARALFFAELAEMVGKWA